MVQEKSLHTFLFETDAEGFYGKFDCLCTPWVDVCVLLHFVRRYKPARFLEIGTHRGGTTRILAERFPEMSIVTVDPGDQIPVAERPAIQATEFLKQDEIGELVRHYPNVSVLRQRVEDIPWGEQRFEMIFVDGNHSFSHVRRDSQLALRLITTPGVIVWHDYNNVPDVKAALHQLDLDGRIVGLHSTWIAYYDTH